MNTPVIIPIPQPRKPSDLEVIDELAREYSNDESIRVHFRNGAVAWKKYSAGSDTPVIGWILGIYGLSLGMAALFGFMSGFANGGKWRERIEQNWFRTPAHYVFFTYPLAYRLGNWLGTPMKGDS